MRGCRGGWEHATRNLGAPWSMEPSNLHNLEAYDCDLRLASHNLRATCNHQTPNSLAPLPSTAPCHKCCPLRVPCNLPGSRRRLPEAKKLVCKYVNSILCTLCRQASESLLDQVRAPHAPIPIGLPAGHSHKSNDLRTLSARARRWDTKLSTCTVPTYLDPIRRPSYSATSSSTGRTGPPAGICF